MNGEESPRPWRVAVYAQCPGLADVFDASGSPSGLVAGELKPADAALIEDAVNERDRHRDIVRRLVRVAIRDRETLRYIYSDTEYATEDDDAIGDALREVRAAIGEGETPTGKGVGK